MLYITKDQQDELRAILAQDGVVMVLSDFDGTVCELNLRDPSAVSMNKTARQALARLSGLPQVEAGILTGRSIIDVQRLVRLPNLLYIGHHGQGQTRTFPAKLKDVIFVPEVIDFKERTQTLLAYALLQQAIGEIHMSAIPEPKVISLALNVGNCPNPKRAALRIMHKLQKIAEKLGFKCTYDITTVEFLPDVPDRNKGAALLDAVHSSRARYVVFCGDSMTDLSALLAIKWLREQGIGGIGVVAMRADPNRKLLEAADLLVPGVAGFLTELVTVLRA